jgi:branched-subunit amino acid aminotransferase/4-amino-4-deoxychorismate lyase
VRVIIDGVPAEDQAASISVFDWAVIRGFGVFEVVRSYEGSLFRCGAHLDRLERSAAALELPSFDRDAVEADMRRVGSEEGDGLVRVVLTGGGRDKHVDAPPRTIIVWEPLPETSSTVRVIPMLAPWHPGTDAGGFAGVKWISYAPNMASTDRAKRAGFDDALLVTLDGAVLEGPTFCVAWVSEGRLETPSLDLGILPSITRDVLLECAARLDIDVKQGHYPLDRLLRSDEAMALSTIKQVTPVELVGETELPIGPMSGQLAKVFDEIVDEET